MKYQAMLDHLAGFCKGILLDTQYRWLERDDEDAIKDVIRHIIESWATDRDTKVFIRFESLRLYKHTDKMMGYDKGLQIESVAIYNNVGGLEKKSLWLNKVVLMNVRGKWKVRTHRARTDPKFLSPLDKEFTAFIQEIMDYLNEKIND